MGDTQLVSPFFFLWNQVCKGDLVTSPYLCHLVARNEKGRLFNKREMLWSNLRAGSIPAPGTNKKAPLFL